MGADFPNPTVKPLCGLNLWWFIQQQGKLMGIQNCSCNWQIVMITKNDFQMKILTHELGVQEIVLCSIILITINFRFSAIFH